MWEKIIVSYSEVLTQKYARGKPWKNFGTLVIFQLRCSNNNTTTFSENKGSITFKIFYHSMYELL